MEPEMGVTGLLGAMFLLGLASMAAFFGFLLGCEKV